MSPMVLHPRSLSPWESAVPTTGVGEESRRVVAAWRQSDEEYRRPVSRWNQDVARRFSELRLQWKRETGFTSSWTDLVLHPAYQAIIGVSPAVLPLLLREMATRPDHWGWALSAITGVDPVPPEDAGRVDRIAAAWVQWGRTRGLLA